MLFIKHIYACTMATFFFNIVVDCKYGHKSLLFPLSLPLCNVTLLFFALRDRIFSPIFESWQPLWLVLTNRIWRGNIMTALSFGLRWTKGISLFCLEPLPTTRKGWWKCTAQLPSLSQLAFSQLSGKNQEKVLLKPAEPGPSQQSFPAVPQTCEQKENKLLSSHVFF